MAIKTHLLIFVSFAIMALSIADAQIDPVIGPVTVIINGTLFCTVNGGPGVNGPATPPFANAFVQLRCSDRTVLASATTTSDGKFVINFRPSPPVLVDLVGGRCQLLVVTPLARCDSALPSDRILGSTGIRLNGVGRGKITPILYLASEGYTLRDQS